MFGLKPREQRAIDASSWGEAWGDISVPTYSGARVTRDTSLSLLAVYGSVRFIADGISTLPIDEYRSIPGGRIEIDPKTPWLEQPTPDLDKVSWTTQVLSSLLLDGNAYLFVQRISEREANVVPLDPKTVTVYRENGKKKYRINGVPAGNLDIRHIPALMLPGSDVGLAPVEMARQTIGTGLATEETAGRFFGQGMQLAGVIETDEDLPPDGPGSASALARQFSRLHSGSNKAHLPAVLVKATWKPSSVSAEQAQFLETRKYTAAQIAGLMFLIDPTDLGIPVDGTSLTYANLEQRNARRVQVTYMPWIVRLERCISQILAGQRYVKYNVNALLRGDLKTRYESYKLASEINTASGGQKPFLTTEEMREFENLDPLPETSILPVAVPAGPQLNSQQPSVVVNLPPMNVDARTIVDVPDVNVDARTTIEPAVVNVDARTNVESPQVDMQLPIEFPDQRFELVMPQQEPAVVNVDARTTIEAAERRPVTRHVLRDKKGDIATIVEE